METLSQPALDDKRVKSDIESNKARALGDSLTHMLDRRLALYHELIALEGDIYQELVNRLQGQIGAMVSLFDAKLEREQ